MNGAVDPEAAAALRQKVTLSCDRCGNTHEATPDGAIQDPLSGSWVGVVDELDPCQHCGSDRWRYVR